MKNFFFGLAFLVLFTSCNLGAESINQGMHYYSIGDYAKAKPLLLEAKDSSLGYYSEKEYNTILGNTYRELGDLITAKSYYKKALKIDANYTDALVNQGIAHRLAGEFDQALASYKKANQINPDNADLHTSMGSLYVYMNKPQLAVKHLEKALELNQNLMLAHSNYSLALAMVGDYSKSDQELKIAEALGYPNGQNIRARISQIKGQAN